jgi:acyl-CoA thioesterase
MDNTTGARQGKPDNVMALKAKEKSEPIASFLKMRLIELTPGYAKVAMKISPEYLNFNNYIFGGIIMSLTDQASNSLDYPSLASQVNIHFLAPAKVGDELTAECRVVKGGRRVAVSEMTVINHDGKLIAKATGTTIPVSESSQ